MHAGKVAHGVTHIELNHADDTLSVFLAPIKGAGGQMLDKSNPLRDFHLLLLSELAGRPGHIGGGVVDRGCNCVHCLLLDVLMLWLVNFLLNCNISAASAPLPQKTDVICSGAVRRQ